MGSDRFPSGDGGRADVTIVASRLRRPTPLDADTITAWSRSPEETARWCSWHCHPVPPEQVVAWWDDAGVEASVLVGSDGRLLGYGELWLDAEEDEVELARLIVAPELRGRGIGQRLVRALAARAAATGLATTFLRVVPDNDTAIGCYLSSGFNRLGPEESATWNEGQPRAYVWMTAAR